MKKRIVPDDELQIMKRGLVAAETCFVRSVLEMLGSRIRGDVQTSDFCKKRAIVSRKVAFKIEAALQDELCLLPFCPPPNAQGSKGSGDSSLFRWGSTTFENFADNAPSAKAS